MARKAVLRSEVWERFFAVPDQGRPGVMMASALRDFVNRWGVALGERVVIFGDTAGIYRTAQDPAAAGVSVKAAAGRQPQRGL